MTAIEVVALIFGASGFWSLITMVINRLFDRKGIVRKSLLALLHDRLYYLCRKYIEIGEITVEDLHNLEQLFIVYEALGGNGTCKELFERCKELKLKVND